MKEILRVSIKNIVRRLLRNAARKQTLAEHQCFDRRRQTFRKFGTVKIRVQSQILLRAQLEKVHDMAAKIIVLFDAAVPTDTADEIIQSDQPVVTDPLTDPAVCQIALMRTRCPCNI